MLRCNHDVTSYVETMMKPCESARDIQWGGHVELAAAANEFGVNVVVLNPCLTTSYFVHAAEEPTDRAIYIVYDGSHYNSTSVCISAERPARRNKGAICCVPISPFIFTITILNLFLLFAFAHFSGKPAPKFCPDIEAAKPQWKSSV